MSLIEMLLDLVLEVLYWRDPKKGIAGVVLLTVVAGIVLYVFL